MLTMICNILVNSTKETVKRENRWTDDFCQYQTSHPTNAGYACHVDHTGPTSSVHPGRSLNDL